MSSLCRQLFSAGALAGWLASLPCHNGNELKMCYTETPGGVVDAPKGAVVAHWGQWGHKTGVRSPDDLNASDIWLIAIVLCVSRVRTQLDVRKKWRFISLFKQCPLRRLVSCGLATKLLIISQTLGKHG